MSVWDYMAEQATDAQRLTALSEASARLVKDFGSYSVPWGEINRFQRNDGAIVQTFDDTKASIPIAIHLLAMGLARRVRRQALSGHQVLLRHHRATASLPPSSLVRGCRRGRSARAARAADPASHHFLDQAQRYADGNFRKVYFYPVDLKGHIERRYRPGQP